MFRLATKFCPIPEAFETARGAGFRAAEFWLSADVLSSWRHVLETARVHPLYYAVHFPNQRDLNAETVEQAVLLCRDLECTALVIHQPLFDLYEETLYRLEPKLPLAVENHQLNHLEFDRWAERNPGLTLDVEHLWKYTLKDGPLDELLATLEGFLTRFGDKLHHVHLPGYRIGAQEHGPMHVSPEMVTCVFTLLADYGFEELVVSEADEEFQNDADLRRDVALFRSWWNEYSSRDQQPPRSSKDGEPTPGLPLPEKATSQRRETIPARPSLPVESEPFHLTSLEIPDETALSG